MYTPEMLTNSVADPDPGSGAFLTPGSGMGKVRIRIRDPDPTRIIFPRAQKPFFWVKILKFYDADPGWKKSGSGMEKSRIGAPG
jgi:hypothetical protein